MRVAGRQGAPGHDQARWAERTFARRPIRTWCTLLASLVVLAATPCAARAQGRAAASTSYEEGAFELVVPGMATATVTVLVSPTGVYLLPLQATLEPLGIPLALVSDSMLARVTRPGGAGSATLRWRDGARSLAVTTAVPLDSSEVVVRGGAVYLAAPRLGQLIESAVDVDLSTLTVRVQREGGFPAQILAGVRERRGEALRRAGRERAPARPLVPFEPTTGFGVVEWAVGGPIVPLGAPSTVEARVGMGLYGGLLKTGGILSLPSRARGASASTGDMSYQRVFPDGTLLRQVQVGDIFSAGAVARPMRGLSLTNAPFVRSQRFGEIPFSRPLPPGWEYEVYEGERLIGYADAATRSALNVPLQYGTTPLHVRLYGPAGEIVESTVSYVIPVEQLPDGEWQYSLGGGRCAVGQCDQMGYADIRRGVSRTLTLQGGADEVGDSAGRSLRPYGAVSWIPSPGWAAQLQGRRAAYLRASVQRYGEGRVSGSASIGANAAGEGGIAVAQETEGTIFAQTSLNLLHMIGALGDRSLTLSTRVERHPHGGGRWDATSFVPIDRGMLEVGVQSNPLLGVVADAPQTPLLRIAPTITLSRGQLRRLGSPLLRVETGFEGASLAQWDVGLSMQPGEGSVSLGLRHLIGTPGTQLTLGGSIALGAARVLARATSRAGASEGAYSVNGAVAFGSVKRAEALDYGGLGLSGVEGVVFRDRDGDGRFGPGDEPAANVAVGVGGLRTMTDSSGRYSTWNALPYEQVDVQIDSLSLGDPSWVPAVGLHSLRPSPQQYTRIDFPLVRTREVIGQLAGPADMPTGGVGIELRGEGSGALYEARTFSDGAFYLSRMRPGRYTLTLAPSSRRALGADIAAPVVVVIPPDGDEVVEVPAVRLARAPQVPATER